MKKLFAHLLFLILSTPLIFASDTTEMSVATLNSKQDKNREDVNNTTDKNDVKSTVNKTSSSSDYIIESEYDGIASSKGKGFSYFTIYQAKDEGGKVVGLYALDEKIHIADTDYATLFPIWRDVWKNDKIISSHLSKKFIKQIFVLSPIGFLPYISPGVNVIFDFPRTLGNVSAGVSLKYFLTIGDIQNFLFVGPNLMWNFYIDSFFDIKTNVAVLASFAPLFGCDFNTFRWALNFKAGLMWYFKRNYGLTLSYDFMPIFKEDLSSSSNIIDFTQHSLNIGVVFLI